jgi:glutathione S-transferase
MYQLFYSPGSCSMAVHVLLNETGQKVELMKADLAAQPRSPELIKHNPRGQVPVLVVDGKTLREGAAILTYLCETHKSPLLPASGWERAKAQEWLAFANSSLHPAYGRAFFLGRQLGEAAATSPVMKAALDSIQKLWDEVEQELQAKPYICGKDITVADILITVIANWSTYFGNAITLGAKTKEYLKRVTSRPAYQQALSTESVVYKVAA